MHNVPGQFASTSAHSIGLSSSKTNESRSIDSSAASSRRFDDLSFQSIRDAAKSAQRITIPGADSKRSLISASLFLLQRHSRKPSALRSLNQCWSLRHLSLTNTPAGVSSATTPSHNVLSQSTTIALRRNLCWIAQIRRMTAVPSAAKYSSVYGKPAARAPYSSYMRSTGYQRRISAELKKLMFGSPRHASLSICSTPSLLESCS